MKKFKFYWLDGGIDEGDGYSVADAFRRLGYIDEAMAALDWWEEIK